ncbi:hypothetical protein [Candidatus Paracaedibacter symbiosus]|uniref:hypothetical protein n=1 Tax=Candidatus Paracaedibacter symbiosus TaxID=244582 RepID=UPI000509BEDA|nr:hypothetical protein [Candidatus Paracaedibacter symbiosus]
MIKITLFTVPAFLATTVFAADHLSPELAPPHSPQQKAQQDEMPTISFEDILMGHYDRQKTYSIDPKIMETLFDDLQESKSKEQPRNATRFTMTHVSPPLKSLENSSEVPGQHHITYTAVTGKPDLSQFEKFTFSPKAVDGLIIKIVGTRSQTAINEDFSKHENVCFSFPVQKVDSGSLQEEKPSSMLRKASPILTRSVGFQASMPQPTQQERQGDSPRSGGLKSKKSSSSRALREFFTKATNIGKKDPQNVSPPPSPKGALESLPSLTSSGSATSSKDEPRSLTPKPLRVDKKAATKKSKSEILKQENTKADSPTRSRSKTATATSSGELSPILPKEIIRELKEKQEKYREI